MCKASHKTFSYPFLIRKMDLQLRKSSSHCSTGRKKSIRTKISNSNYFLVCLISLSSCKDFESPIYKYSDKLFAPS